MNREQARGLLRTALGDDRAEFRDGQWEAIDLIVNRRRKVLIVERTGWGKSCVYFIGTRILRDRGAGPTLIVSPLLALMRNQIEAANRLGIRAASIDSTNRQHWQDTRSKVLAGEIDALLVSPERLANDGFVEQVLSPLAGSVGLLVVDEAHCISDWGHDFRPDYRRLLNVLRQMPPNMPVLCTTATANDRVVEDVRSQIGDLAICRGPLVRESLILQTLVLPDQTARLAWLAQRIPTLTGTGIVYVLTKRDALQVSAWLTQNGIAAQPYYSDVQHPDHADSNAYRCWLEERLLRNELKALVATTALGMGYDKPDLGFVIHYQTPGSIIGYYQQVGRAGRAIAAAHGILLAGAEDAEIHAYFRRTAFPDEAHVREILDALERHDGLKLPGLQAQVNLRKGQIEQVLKYLSVESPSPVIKSGSEWRRTPVAYRMGHDRIERLTRQREQEYREVERYLASAGCLMNYLRVALDDPHASGTPCGRCTNCVGRAIVAADFDPALAVAAARFLKRSELPLEPRKQIPQGAFPIYDLPTRLPDDLRAAPGRILARWQDAGWGRIVADGKRNNRFSDELVRAMADMIDNRWRPDPRPAYIVCVPSRRHPDLVPDLARRLAAALRLPFADIVAKVRDNQPQKLQENSFHQCRNLDGAFEIGPVVPGEPVLLVDDIVDSGWTMSVLAALLRRAGSGPVYPVALATTNPGD